MGSRIFTGRAQGESDTKSTERVCGTVGMYRKRPEAGTASRTKVMMMELVEYKGWRFVFFHSRGWKAEVYDDGNHYWKTTRTYKTKSELKKILMKMRPVYSGAKPNKWKRAR
jgi:hypothetical protein